MLLLRELYLFLKQIFKSSKSVKTIKFWEFKEKTILFTNKVSFLYKITQIVIKKFPKIKN